MGVTKIAKAEPFAGEPRIHLAAVIGASPDKPFLLRIPVTGQRPMRYSVRGLPEGLFLTENRIFGSVKQAGNYRIVLEAENMLGKAEKAVTLEIAPEHLQITPLLGFTTWNAFGADVTQQDVETMAEKLVQLGIAEYGYQYVNLDSGWQLGYGGDYDAVMPNQKFPDMKQMTDKIHGLGLKCGIYSTPMLTAWGCPKELESIPGCTQGAPDIRFAMTNGGIGTVHKEKNNVRQWEAWEFDYLKYDWKPTDPVNAERMRQELVRSGRDFVFSVTIKALKEYHTYWSTCCNSYRSGPDTHGNWQNLVKIFRNYLEFAEYTNRGHYYDMDMLDVGTCRCDSVTGKFTEDEQIAAYSLRAFLGSPLQLSSTMEQIGDFELSLYCNEEILAIHQDAAFSPPVQILCRDEADTIVYGFERALEDGCYGYAFFNLGETPQSIHTAFENRTLLRDVWAKEDVAAGKAFSFPMEPHTVRIFKSKESMTAQLL